MNATEIIKYLEETQGWKEAPPDHPVYSAPLTIRFINHQRSKTPMNQEKESEEK